MSKRFNGRKYSHGSSKKSQKVCPLCGYQMRMFLGKLRCTEIKKAKKGGNERRVVKHGSIKTIQKRLEQKAEAV